jgi:hypothetical protein
MNRWSRRALAVRVLFLLLPFLVVWRADALALFAFFGVVHAHLLRMLGLPILRVVRVLTFLGRLVLVAMLVVLPALLVFGLAHRGTPSLK